MACVREKSFLSYYLPEETFVCVPVSVANSQITAQVVFLKIFHCGLD